MFWKVQFDEHPSFFPFKDPKSHSSEPLTISSPHVVSHTEGSPEHAHPDSISQLKQPSPE